MMLNRGAAAGRALASAAASSRSAVRASDATRAASNISIGADGSLKVPNDPIVPFIEVRSALAFGPVSATP
jgi:hypothetical protein